MRCLTEVCITLSLLGGGNAFIPFYAAWPTRQECIIGQSCELQWATTDCADTSLWKLWLSHYNSDEDRSINETTAVNVVENSCRYTVPPDVTSTFHEGQSWSILMAPYDTSSNGGWNPDEGFYYNERPNFFTAINAFTFYDVDRNGVGCGIEKQRGLSNAAIAGIAVGSAVWGFLVCVLVLGSILARQQTRLEKKILAVYPDAASVWLDATGTNTIDTSKPKNYSRPSKADTGIRAEPESVRIAPVIDPDTNSLPSLRFANHPNEIIGPTHCSPSTRTLSSPIVLLPSPEEVDHDSGKIQQDNTQPSNCILEGPRKG